VIWAVGRTPATIGMGLETLEVRLDSGGHVIVDEFQRTSVEHVYAIGDITQHAGLTPVAIARGRRLVRPAVWRPARTQSWITRTFPPWCSVIRRSASVGLSEEDARRRYGEAVEVYQTSFVPMYHVFTGRKPRNGHEDGHARRREEDRRHSLIGDGADEMLQGFAVALRMGATSAISTTRWRFTRPAPRKWSPCASAPGLPAARCSRAIWRHGLGGGLAEGRNHGLHAIGIGSDSALGGEAHDHAAVAALAESAGQGTCTVGGPASRYSA